MRTSEQALLISSSEDGTWVPVIRMEYVEVRDAGKDDVIQVSARQGGPATFRIRGSGKHLFRLPKGFVKVERVSGSSLITVVALCERYYHGIEADARRSVRRASDPGG